MPSGPDTSNPNSISRKPAGSTLPKPAPRRAIYPYMPPVAAANTEDIESDEAVSSEDEDTGEDTDEHDTATPVQGITMLIDGPIYEDDDDEDSDTSFVDDSAEMESKPSKKSKGAAATITAATKRLKITSQKAGSSLPKGAPKSPLPERPDLDPDELACSEESDEAESSEDGDDDESDSDVSEQKNLTMLLFGGSASGSEDTDEDDGEWPEPSHKGPKTRSIAKARDEAKDGMDVDA